MFYWFYWEVGWTPELFAQRNWGVSILGDFQRFWASSSSWACFKQKQWNRWHPEILSHSGILWNTNHNRFWIRSLHAVLGYLWTESTCNSSWFWAVSEIYAMVSAGVLSHSHDVSPSWVCSMHTRGTPKHAFALPPPCLHYPMGSTVVSTIM